MVNKHRGEVALGEYTLVLTYNALCDLEAELAPMGVDLDSIGAEMEKRGARKMTILRAVIWAALQEKHLGTNLQDAGRIIGEVGIPAAGAAVTKAFQESFLSGEVAGGNADPQDARAA